MTAAVQRHDKKDTLSWKIGHNYLLPIFRLIQHYVIYAVNRPSLIIVLQHRFEIRCKHVINNKLVYVLIYVVNTFVFTR